MYINDVIRQVQNYNPSEYGRSEMYTWCNEVSAMLAVEDRIVYREIRPPIAGDGSVLLPEDAAMENIVKVYLGGREIPKRNYLTHDGKLRRLRGRAARDAVIVYEQPYQPIRMPKYIGELRIDSDNNALYINDCEFVPGDMLIIQLSGETVGDIPLLEVEYDPDNIRGYILSTPDGSLDGFTEAHSDNAVITREITDKTVCGTPYDTMYTDYILAKIAQYQKDTAACALYMNSFNTKLAQYKQWLASRMPHEKRTFRNWW